MQLQHTIGNRAVGKLLTEIGLIPSKAMQAPPVQMQTIPEEEEQLLQGKFETIQRQEIQEPEEEPLQGKFENRPEQETCSSCSTPYIQQEKENLTGMPDDLKADVENLSGIDMSDVRGYYNLDKPAEVGALAYTQGTNIHVAPGQERNLPHEAWHVVQQAQSRVKPTIQLKDVSVNDNMGLEREADEMGKKALQMKSQSIQWQEIANIPKTQIKLREQNLVDKNRVTQLYKELCMYDRWSVEDEAAYRKVVQEAYATAKMLRGVDTGGYCIAVGCVTVDRMARGNIARKSSFKENKHAEQAVIEVVEGIGDIESFDAIFVEYKPCVTERRSQEIKIGTTVLDLVPYPCSVYLQKKLPLNFPVFYLGWPHKAIE